MVDHVGCWRAASVVVFLVIVACKPGTTAQSPSMHVPASDRSVPDSHGFEEFDFATVRRHLDSLRNRTPEQDARRAIVEGDRRLWGLEGYSLILPSVGIDDYRRAKLQYGFRVFPHTGDFVAVENGDSSWVWWQKATAIYAERYNRTVLALVPLRP